MQMFDVQYFAFCILHFDVTTLLTFDGGKLKSEAVGAYSSITCWVGGCMWIEIAVIICEPFQSRPFRRKQTHHTKQI